MVYCTSMRQDKDLVFKLRRDGKSYREIQDEINISRSTLCDWFRNEEWSTHIKRNNITKNIKLSTERLELLHIGRSRMLADKYKQVEIEAEKEFQIFIKDPLFIAGLMIYAGEGDKRSNNMSRVSNSEFYIHKIFIKFAEKYLYITKENIKIALIIYPDLDPNECTNKWSGEVGISISNFHKTQVIKGKEKTKKLQYGVGISIISSIVVVKKKILKWLELSSRLEF
ncbi:MAG: hypothetical protein US21_C0004G0018 [Candidatus Nomurabacteria bacterium GW2011_GWB1_36_6]|nr:MAG: hypothetical protein US21_C0004G0018 [Candidatus Nomurabacteria bacterium GW2011_GWB1_36_6]